MRAAKPGNACEDRDNVTGEDEAKSLLIPLVTLGGCAVVNTAPPPEQVRQLRDVRDACLARNVVALDDYRSDAATIGMAVVSACRYENTALVDAIAGPDGFRRDEIARQIEQNSRDAATQAVVMHRAQRRSSRPPERKIGRRPMVTADTGPKDPESVLAGAIAARRWGARTGVSVRPLGQGSNNTLYLAVGGNERLVIKLSRPHREAAALDEYRKEAWCAGRARELDVATPEVLECGVFDGRAFQVQSFVDGRAPSASQALSTWQALGGYRAAHQFDPCCRMGPHPRGRRPLRRKLDGAPRLQHRGPRPGDELVARGFLTEASSLRLRGELEHLARRDFRFGLCHGDIALWNTLIDGSGRPWLLDWGCAAASVVPHHEINEILRTARPGKPQLAAFLTGYGLSAKDMAAMAQELRVLAALRETDTLRWAIEKQPARIASLGERARRAAADLD